MGITIEVLSLNGAPPADRIFASFDSGGSIGRSPECTLVLPDEKRAVSRLHATLTVENGRARIVDEGVNPILVNDTSLGKGASAPLADGDTLVIGPYELSVSIEARSASASPIPASIPAVGDDFDDLLGLSDSPVEASVPDADRDLLASAGDDAGSTGDAAVDPQPAPVPHAAAPPEPFASAPVPLLPSDFDPLESLESSEPFEPLEPEPAAKHDDAAPPRLPDGTDWLHDSKPPPIEADPDTPTTFRPVGTPAPAAIPAAAAPVAPAARSFPSPPPEPARPPPLRQDAPAARVPPPAAKPSPRARGAGPGADHADLLAALLSGLDAPDLGVDALTPELMRKLGVLIRESTQGTLDLLNARGTVKREMRADMTMIASTQNNPLKFSPDIRIALRYLLGPRMPGFMDAEPAMRDAYRDLRAHEFGVVAGMRAALLSVLQRFSPEQLEARIPEKGGIGGLIAANRRARLWELFTALHRQLMREAEDDFQALFGREFLRAYEEHVSALQQQKRSQR